MSKELSRVEYQQQFVESVVGRKAQEPLIDQMIPVGELDVEGVISVYSGDYYARLKEGIGETLEGCWAVLGDEAFFQISEEYLHIYPSSKPDLGQLADRFPEFLKSHAIVAEYPFLLDLVNYELEFWRVFHLPKPLEKESPSIDPEQLFESKMQFVNHLRTFSWDFQVYRAWQKRQEGFDGEPMQDYEQPQSIMLFKSGNQVKGVEITKPQFIMLERLINGKSFADSVEGVDLSQEDLQNLFFQLQSNHLIESYYK